MQNIISRYREKKFKKIAEQNLSRLKSPVIKALIGWEFIIKKNAMTEKRN